MSKNNLIAAIIVGLIASIAFILIQPFFGMATLTSRHAAAYVNLGAYSDISALILSWIVHIGVSIAYALLSAAIFHFKHTPLVNSAQIIILGWLTTLIATPANEWVVKLITTQQFPALNSLSPLNTDIGAKFWLHIMFFAFIVAGLWFIKKQKWIAPLNTPEH